MNTAADGFRVCSGVAVAAWLYRVNFRRSTQNMKDHDAQPDERQFDIAALTNELMQRTMKYKDIKPLVAEIIGRELTEDEKRTMSECINRKRQQQIIIPSQSSSFSRPHASGKKGSPSSGVSSLLTVVISTSPVASNPDTGMLEEVLSTFALVPQLGECQKIIVCDGFKVRDKAKYRAGCVTADGAKKYKEYIEKLRSLVDQHELFMNTRIVELGERQGFGYAMKTIMEDPSQVTTPLVMVVQHDRTFMKGFPLAQVVRVLQNHKHIQYIGLPTSSQNGIQGSHKEMQNRHPYVHFVASKYKVDLAPFIQTTEQIPELKPASTASTESATANNLRLIPLVQWYDSTHVCCTDHYRDFIFSHKVARVRKGGFIEDKLGQQQLAAIKEHGMSAHAPYGTYFLDDGSGDVVVSHLNARDPLAHRKFRNSAVGAE